MVSKKHLAFVLVITACNGKGGEGAYDGGVTPEADASANAKCEQVNRSARALSTARHEGVGPMRHVVRRKVRALRQRGAYCGNEGCTDGAVALRNEGAPQSL
jgi:hypothetical protein